MTERKEASKRRFLHQRKAPECTCKQEKPKDTMLDVLLKIASLFAIIVGILSSLFHHLFAIYAEHFYGVPSLYFYDRKLDFGATGLLVLILAFIWLIPFFVKKVSKESEFNVFNRLFLSFVVALLVLFESLLFSMCFLNNEFSFIPFSLGFSIISFFGYDHLFLSVARNNENEGTRKCKITNLDIKNSEFMEIISKILYLLTAVTISLMTFLLTMKFSPLDPLNQKSYEFISREENEYYIIVGHYQDSVILMRGSTLDVPKRESTSVEPKRGSTKESKETETQLTIIKGDYRIEPLGERQIEYRQFDKVGIDDKNKKK